MQISIENRRTFVPAGLVWPKISGRRGRLHQPFSLSETRMNDLWCGIRMWAQVFVTKHTLDRQTDKLTERPCNTMRCIICSRMVKIQGKHLVQQHVCLQPLWFFVLQISSFPLLIFGHNISLVNTVNFTLTLLCNSDGMLFMSAGMKLVRTVDRCRHVRHRILHRGVGSCKICATRGVCHICRIASIVYITCLTFVCTVVLW